MLLPRRKMGLGLRANIWLITAKTFEAAKRGDWENCAPCEDKTSVDLDKDWHALHYLLTGDTKFTFLHTAFSSPELTSTTSFIPRKMWRRSTRACPQHQLPR
jgi:hypothetical protein